jgi:hypothetical protein
MSSISLNKNSLVELIGQGYTRGHLETPNAALQEIFANHKLEMAEQKKRPLDPNPILNIFNNFSADLTENKFCLKDRLLRTVPLVEPAMTELLSCFENVAKKLSDLVLENQTLKEHERFNSKPLNYIFKTPLEHYEIFSKQHSTIQHNHIDYGSGKLLV